MSVHKSVLHIYTYTTLTHTLYIYIRMVKRNISSEGCLDQMFILCVV